MGIAIRAEGLSKEYRLGAINRGMLFRDIQSWAARKRGKPDPHEKVGAVHYEDLSDRFWALKDLNFEIEQGDRVGIIGRNGAGKSTLLKILSRITAPTEGRAMIRGRVVSLLEVGTGFHPELTGRENIFLNGAILGMKRRQVAKKLDEIIAFSEIEKFIDTPVKRYSSGMYVRLAFSVAAHLDSDILLADEVLAVGDVAFQKKCLGKMEDVSKNKGRTVLFVSHNMNSVLQLCRSGMLLRGGRLWATEPNIERIVAQYFRNGQNDADSPFWVSGAEEPPNPFFHALSFGIGPKDPGTDSALFPNSAEYYLSLEFMVQEVSSILTFSLMFYASDEKVLFSVSPFSSIPNYKPHLGLNKIRCTLPAYFFNIQRYRVELNASLFKQEWILEPGKNSPYIFFEIGKYESRSPFSTASGRSGVLAPVFFWVELEDSI
jgi:lipopolysaccharide transport system ATP-binding protein